jgi:hypothetical protein
VFKLKWLRAGVFRFVSELAIAYRRSPAVADGSPRRRSGLRAGDRFPDARISRDGRETYLQKELSGPRFQLVLCGDVEPWDRDRLATIVTAHGGLLELHHLTRGERPGALVDADGRALARLGVRRGDEAVHYLVRPDGYIGVRCFGRDLGLVERYLSRWLA